MSSKLPASLRYQSLNFELTTYNKSSKIGFQNREDEALLEVGGNANVRNWYMRTGLPKFAPYSMSSKLPASLRYQSLNFELTLGE